MSHLLFVDYVLFFAEAADDKGMCILEGINRFCKAFGQRINFSKSFVLFSTNLSNNQTLRLSTSLGIKRTAELGVYLGHNVQYHKSSSSENSKLLERVRGRLDRWKSKCLSEQAA